jgi:hypothetical protein
MKGLETEADALEDVRHDDCALMYVPEALRTAEVCMEAVRQCGWALEYVPEGLKAAVKAALEPPRPAA